MVQDFKCFRMFMVSSQLIQQAGGAGCHRDMSGPWNWKTRVMLELLTIICARAGCGTSAAAREEPRHGAGDSHPKVLLFPFPTRGA